MSSPEPAAPESEASLEHAASGKEKHAASGHSLPDTGTPGASHVAVKAHPDEKDADKAHSPATSKTEARTETHGALDRDGASQLLINDPHTLINFGRIAKVIDKPVFYLQLADAEITDDGGGGAGN